MELKIHKRGTTRDELRNLFVIRFRSVEGVFLACGQWAVGCSFSAFPLLVMGSVVSLVDGEPNGSVSLGHNTLHTGC